MGKEDKNGIPMLFPVEAEEFWKRMRGIVREELAGQVATKKEKVEFTTPGLTYKPLYKMKEVCALLGVTRPTVYDWVKHGTLKPYKIRSRVYFLWDDVQKLLHPE
jgi:excisionase family DNA binding protein